MGVDVPVWFIIRGYSQSSQMPSEAGHENRVGTLSGEEGRSLAASPLPDGNVSVNTRRETCVKGVRSWARPNHRRTEE